MRKIAKLILLFVFLIIFFSPTQSVYADIAPPSQPSGSNVVPGEVTMVQMIYERVVIDLRPPWSDGENADVTAKFVMRNQGTVDEQMTVGFPLNHIGDMNFDGSIPKLQNLIVKIDNVLVPLQYPDNYDWMTNQDQETLSIHFAVFDVTFPVGQNVIIELNYKQPPTYYAPTTQYDYTLITGAGWYGTILEGDIVFRLPYTISFGENYWTYDYENDWGGLKTETVVENEARWHFDDFEPQNYAKDNWIVHVIRPKDWIRVLSAREALINNQYDSELWMELGNAYSNAAIKLGGKTCDSSSKAILAYQQSIALNQNSAEGHALLAQEYYKAYCDSEFNPFGTPPDRNLRQAALQELSVAISLDTNNKTALELQEYFEMLGSGWEPLPPTPYMTPTINAVLTLIPTDTPIVAAVVHTKIVSEPKVITATPEPRIPTATPSPTEIPVQDETQKESSATPMILGALILFVAGIGVGVFWQKRKK